MGKNYQGEETFNERMLKVREALKRNVKKSLESSARIASSPTSEEFAQSVIENSPMGLIAGRLGKFAKEARTPEAMRVKPKHFRAEYSNLPDEKYAVQGKKTYTCPNKCVDTPQAKGCMACKSPFDKGFDMASFIEFHGGRYKQAVRNIIDSIDDYHKGNVTPTFAERMRKSGLLDLPEEKINVLRKEANK